MSAGHTGQGTPDEGDDPFAYLYRPENGQAQAPQGPRQPSYNQVRPVGERTFGGQQGHRQPPAQPPRPDAYYAAPETQPGGTPPYGGPPDRRRPAPEPRRNGLLIGAIAVVVAVVLGVGAAILFSGDENDPEAGGGSTTEPTDDGGDGGGEEPTDDPSDDPTDEEPDPGELPAAELTDLQLGNGAAVASEIGGARSADGSYIAIQGAPGSTVTWTFDFTGEPGLYRLYTGYSTVTEGQGMSFAVNGTPRTDPVNMKDYATGSDQWDSSWVSTYNQVELKEGANTVQFTCTSSCDVIIDQMYITEDRDQS
ncbi:carbohydrate-binding protein [Streptomyces litchfieldiae]|uniref:Carbohydrate-binding protein n=1 Tax=Streptomyces litchfieldiae TaxID=3075543 RepID=A0ABU2MPJ1_9ACTN|nr:hypothetical protein [Streptomyces sp. DSM 44938]MDT0343317.1 hypothetical protein [Streptomyces sp. DSM 44938]